MPAPHNPACGGGKQSSSFASALIRRPGPGRRRQSAIPAPSDPEPARYGAAVVEHDDDTASVRVLIDLEFGWLAAIFNDLGESPFGVASGSEARRRLRDDGHWGATSSCLRSGPGDSRPVVHK